MPRAYGPERVDRGRWVINPDDSPRTRGCGAEHRYEVWAQMDARPQLTAVNAAFGRAAHVMLDDPPYVFEDTLGMPRQRTGGITPSETTCVAS